MTGILRDKFDKDIKDRWGIDLSPHSNDELEELIEELQNWIYK